MVGVSALTPFVVLQEGIWFIPFPLLSEYLFQDMWRRKMKRNCPVQVYLEN